MSAILDPQTIQYLWSYTLGILNIYGYNQTTIRTRLWNQIRTFPLPTATWITCGDYNMIERLQDKLGGLLHTGTSPNETIAWTRLNTHLGPTDAHLLDDFTKLSSKMYTWDN
jgi:hypothetical protein